MPANIPCYKEGNDIVRVLLQLNSNVSSLSKGNQIIFTISNITNHLSYLTSDPFQLTSNTGNDT